KDGNGEVDNIPFNNGTTDPIETFTDTMGVIPFQRAKAAAGTGVNNARQQINTVSSYIDGWAVYGGTNARLDFLRNGSQDGNPDKHRPHQGGGAKKQQAPRGPPPRRPPPRRGSRRPPGLAPRRRFRRR